MNLASIALHEESYLAEKDLYFACTANPADVPGTTKAAWGAPADFTTIGFVPRGAVYYRYKIAIAGLTFDASATGDLDGDAALGNFTLDEVGLFSNTNKGVY